MTHDWPMHGRVLRMPAAIGGVFISFLANTGLLAPLVGALGFAGVGALALGVGYVTLALGAYALSAAFAKKPAAPQPSDVQANIRQEISPRRRIYGCYLAGSVIVFGFRRGEKSYILHYLGEGPIKQYVGFRLDKKPVTLDANGFVTTSQYVVDGRSRVQILTTLGLATDGPFQKLLDAFPELDTPLTPFRHRGCAMVLQIVEQVDAEEMPDVYPNNLPSLQVVGDFLNDIPDPATGTAGFSDNAGRCLLAEVCNVYGLDPTDGDAINIDSWSDFAAHCDESVLLKAGGSEKRYRAAGVVMMDAENESRINALASVCNADVFMDPRGRVAVRPKLRSTPAIALRAKYGDHLTVQLEGGRTLQKGFNTVKITYVDPSLNWKANEVRWKHAGFLDQDGQEYSEPLGVTLCPSPTQAQRLGKLFLHGSNPEFIGQLTSGPQALDLIEDYCFTLDLSPEDDFERVANATGMIEYDPEQMVTNVPVAIFAEDATTWDPETDEQDQVVVPPSLPSNVDDVALDVTVSVSLQNNSAPILEVTWDAAGSATLPDSYTQQVQISVADADDWHDASVNGDNDTAKYGPVADGAAYDGRIRNIANGKKFDWQTFGPVTVTVDPTAPAALLSFSADDGTGQFVANFGTSNDSHLATVAIYKTPSGDTLNRLTDFVGKYAVAPGISYALPLTSDPGTFDIYAEPLNVSSIAGPLSGPDSATVS
jgi:hypothetical protein